MKDFEGLHALVTGGSRGIGAAIAAALTQGGARVTIMGRKNADLAAQVASGNAAAYAVADLADSAAFEKTVAGIAEKEPIDILVNNAGMARSAPFLRTTDDDFEILFRVNVLGAVIASRVALPGMMTRKFGRIINIASTAALKGHPYISAYVTSKHALLGLTRSLAMEQAKTGVTVNAVCPGFTDTDMVDRAVDLIVAKTGRDAGSARAEIVKTSPMGRLITPAEVADAVCFLARRESGGITGTAITVAGGEA